LIFQRLENIGTKSSSGWKIGGMNSSRFSVLIVSALAAFVSSARDVTFISTSDSHYREADDRRGNHNELNRGSMLEMNRIKEESWPEKLGGGKIAKPRGVLLLGDVIDDGDRAQGGRNVSAEQYKLFLADFGLDGTDGLLKLPVFDGWGNHDGPPVGKEKNGFSFQAQLLKRNAARLKSGAISNVSSNGLHYSWDWDDVHFVQLNIYPADKQREGVRYSPVWHDPQFALAFLKQDLAEKVGTSGRPVVLMSHCGFDTDWWVKEDWKDAYDAAKNYNVILYLYGHSGTGVRQWAPDGETKKWDCINDGQTDKGFFVIQITDARIRAAMRIKTGIKVTKETDGKETRTWDGGWEWKWFFDKPVAAAAK
jgi:cytolysin (calcineurin-like family phosphatase)